MTEIYETSLWLVKVSAVLQFLAVIFWVVTRQTPFIITAIGLALFGFTVLIGLSFATSF